LLPAVGAAIESARKTQCQNNLRNLAQGLGTFETRKERFPGYTNRVGNFRGSWCVEALPFVEREDIYNRWLDGTITSGYVEIFICPSDPPDSQNAAYTSYAANAGYATWIKDHAAATGNSQREAISNGVFHNYFPWNPGGPNGKVRGPSINHSQFSDGLSTTLLLAENIQATTWDSVSTGGDSVASDKLTTVFVWHNSANTDRQINGNKYATNINADLARPSSAHSGGVMTAFADQHVQFLRQDIEYRVYVQLMTPRHADVPAGDPPLPNAWRLPANILTEADYR
jgi:hypothetical protein